MGGFLTVLIYPYRISSEKKGPCILRSNSSQVLCENALVSSEFPLNTYLFSCPFNPFVYFCFQKSRFYLKVATSPNPAGSVHFSNKHFFFKYWICIVHTVLSRAPLILEPQNKLYENCPLPLKNFEIIFCLLDPPSPWSEYILMLFHACLIIRGNSNSNI